MDVHFTPESEIFASDTREYEQIWKEDGGRIYEAVKARTLLPGPAEVAVVVYEGISNSGSGNSPMKLRASYSKEIKKGTLVHELGHRFIEPLKDRPTDVDEHHILFLFLFDVWMSLYGEEFALNMVRVESGRKGKYDYEDAWKWALRLSPEDRKAKYLEVYLMNQTRF